MIEIIGYVLAILIGVSLGLIGGGGSILTVPVLVYLLGISPVLGTAYSLFIVGAASLVGSVRYASKKQVDFRTALIFGIPSIAAVYFTRKTLVPAIPETLLNLGSFELTKNMFLMLLFAILMLVAAFGMIRKKPAKKEDDQESPKEINGKLILVVLLEGLVVGVLTGLVGAGGGFLIIPALVIFGGLRMKVAIGTSLTIISVKSLIGFLGDVSNYSIDWTFLLLFSGLAMAGIFLGSFLSTKIDGSKLQKGFGWFVLVMGALVLMKELL